LVVKEAVFRILPIGYGRLDELIGSLQSSEKFFAGQLPNFPSVGLPFNNRV
jgi:hypothetical protein